ncbi:3-oxoacyl-(acyl-carrier-protein) synthase III [Corynebacterium mustelae]|uniref:3-oxoacyl-(Acyl-carrier-protein) synthase III n=1 Tax=Corynebacterium mustelae TaxID=571915 RepID=A0A0G3H7U6_9CORY|nr:3-oxoacyl-[acyl-carrier-protein] synthase III C-terminal domain-containing protein [Corynebacterium mustelae]AKK07192.1 3-oxoacyl-(acyl-carrier-protein) synthase III [Corynebacterium mustelae]
MLNVDIVGLGSSVGEEKSLSRIDYPVDAQIKALEAGGYNHFYKSNKSLREMGGDAAVKALQNAGLTAGDIDFIVGAHTDIADYPGIDFACQVGAELGVDRIRTRCITEGCGSAVTAFDEASNMLKNGGGVVGLVVQAQKVSDAHHDRFSLLNGILSDAAVATVVTVSGEHDEYLLRLGSFAEVSIPYFVDMMRIEFGGSAQPMIVPTSSPEYYKPGRERIQDIYRMTPEELYHFIEIRSSTMADVIAQVKRNAQWDESAGCLFHTLEGVRSIAEIARQSRIKRSNADLVSKHGHCGCADPILSFIDYFESGRLHRGERIILSTISTGMKWAALTGIVGDDLS